MEIKIIIEKILKRNNIISFTKLVMKINIKRGALEQAPLLKNYENSTSLT